ncbi:hypothetical protein FI667_g5027, partial [Globisporangium splendens]
MKKGAPKYQNTFAFKHNPKSKKTEKILAMPIQGLCEQCTNQIEWRKKYRKFKPLTQPANCIFCRQKCVLAAYHAACDPCAKERDICAKCCKKKEIVLNEKELAALRVKEAKEFEESLEGMRERERRAQLRKLEKEREEEKRLRREAAGLVEGGDGYESYDEDEFDMDDDDL